MIIMNRFIRCVMFCIDIMSRKILIPMGILLCFTTYFIVSPSSSKGEEHAAQEETETPNTDKRPLAALVVMFFPTSSDPSNASVADYRICDGLSVLLMSFRLHSANVRIKAFALMLERDRAWEPILTNTEYNPIVVDPPNGVFARLQDGIVGALELVKLQPLLWWPDNYSTVIVLDSDVMVNPSGAHQIIDLVEGATTSIEYTFNGQKGVYDINGGVLIFHPSNKTIRHYHEMMGIFKNGTRRGSYNKKSGWFGSGIGFGWGGTTIQGLVPYNFEIRKPSDRKVLDHCVFNNNVKYCWMRNSSVLPALVHFAAADFCPKPWNVPKWAKSRYCENGWVYDRQASAGSRSRWVCGLVENTAG